MSITKLNNPSVEGLLRWQLAQVEQLKQRLLSDLNQVRKVISKKTGGDEERERERERERKLQ